MTEVNGLQKSNVIKEFCKEREKSVNGVCLNFWITRKIFSSRAMELRRSLQYDNINPILDISKDISIV